ncbi:hypothetical protein Sjap_011910 [Stephania japonica]|uniref:Uncharacterized protein n=1 Tax=Stephania japonica TaxID=461633 RepID=A0AAP0P5F1_9MAGN
MPPGLAQQQPEHALSGTGDAATMLLLAESTPSEGDRPVRICNTYGYPATSESDSGLVPV